MIAKLFRLRLARNSAYVVAGRLWYIVLWFLITPFVLDKLGAERFGVWSLLFLLSGYLATFDLGLGVSVVRFTAEASAGKTWGSLSRTLSEICFVYVALGIFWVALIFFVQPILLDWLDAPAQFETEIRHAILVSAIIFAFANVASTGVGVLNGLQRMALSNGILILSSIPQLVTLVVGLNMGYGLYAAVASTAAQWLTTALAAWLLLRWQVPQVRWPRFRLPRRKNEWFGYSSVMQINNVLVLTQQQIDKALITAWAGLRYVAEFELGFRVALGIQSIPVLAMSPLLPLFAEVDATGDRVRFQKLWRDGTRYITLIALGLGACVIPVAPLIVSAWLGAEHPIAGVLAQWLIAGFAVNLCTGVVTNAARGAGHPVMEIVPALVALAVHVTASWYLIGRSGAVGVGPAFLLAMTVWTVLYFIQFARWSGTSLAWLLYGIFARPVLASIPAFGIGMAAAGSLPALWLESRWGTLAGAVVAAAPAGVAFLVAWWALGRVIRDRAE